MDQTPSHFEIRRISYRFRACGLGALRGGWRGTDVVKQGWPLPIDVGRSHVHSSQISDLQRTAHSDCPILPPSSLRFFRATNDCVMSDFKGTLSSPSVGDLTLLFDSKRSRIPGQDQSTVDRQGMHQEGKQIDQDSRQR